MALSEDLLRATIQVELARALLVQRVCELERLMDRHGWLRHSDERGQFHARRFRDPIEDDSGAALFARENVGQIRG